MADTALKEFFYVDVDRTRSLLAQLQGGVIESLTSETANTLEGSASASLFGIGGSGGYTRGSSHQESRSFQEMTFVAFESLADQHDLIADMSEDVSDANRWESGEVHMELQEGQLIRVTCDVQVLDGALFRGRLNRFEQMANGVLSLAPDPTPKHSTPQQRKQLAGAAKAALMGGIQSDQLEAMAGFVDAFVGDDIAFRAMVCGPEHLTLGFGGTLLGRREYIQEERESLFGRYGTVASSWTCVMQVAAIPKQNVANPDDDDDVDDDEDAESSDSDSGFDRAQFEGIAINLLAMMEQVGIVDGPRWPTISVTPLAVYRSVPKPATGRRLQTGA